MLKRMSNRQSLVEEDRFGLVSICNKDCKASLLSVLAACGVRGGFLKKAAAQSPQETTLDNNDGPEVEDTIEKIMERICAPFENEHEFVDHGNLAELERLLGNRGLECVVFLPVKHATKPPTGKKCILKCNEGLSKGEIRLRTKGEMKKIKFSWADMKTVGEGRYKDETMSHSQYSQYSENYEECFLHFVMAEKGVVELLLADKQSRNAVVMGLSILAHRLS